MIEQEIHNNDCSVVSNTENLSNTEIPQKASNPVRPRYIATGVVANARLSPLLPDHWEDISRRRAALESKTNKACEAKAKQIPDFLWENAPRHETKEIRDHVTVYSHLPNGINILDSKWVLGRLFSDSYSNENNKEQNPCLATCETHCFTGPAGFEQFARSVQLLAGETTPDSKEEIQKLIQDLPDIAPGKQISTQQKTSRPPSTVLNWWVVKDAGANGAGGVWVVGNDTAQGFATSGPLLPKHKYVAQQYVWPPVLYEGKKCHVRVYTTITCDGRAFVHQRAFLHVANDLFRVYGNDTQTTSQFEDCVHITNCCANSHDDKKFAGEILANFGNHDYCNCSKTNQPIVPLAEFFPSVQATVSEVCSRIFENKLLEGGMQNQGFEYCGMDFMLSFNSNNQPVAYLLEINSPPSQDTASSLPHAEDLHNEVLRDWMKYWVIPKVDPTIVAQAGGWTECPVRHCTAIDKDKSSQLPSKAAVFNKFRWALLERKLQKKETSLVDEKGTQQSKEQQNDTADETSKFARSQFPFFSACSNERNHQVFFENAGGAQVPQSVIDQMTISLTKRHRERIGGETKLLARETLKRLLVGEGESVVVLGLNATSLLQKLAHQYAKLLTPNDEVLISTENHLANFDPWIQAAKTANAKIKLWSMDQDLRDLVTPQTRVVAFPHASNVLGSVRPIGQIASIIKECSGGYAHVVVDGVAVAPHEYVGFSEREGVDWYVVSMHKLFGPHIGVLLGRPNACLNELLEKVPFQSNKSPSERIQSLLESGTANIEGCAGVIGLGTYFKSLSRGKITNHQEMISVQEAKLAYRKIRSVESALLDELLRGLGRCSQVRILDGGKAKESFRLPTVSFVHQRISSHDMYTHCQDRGIICRNGFFLCTKYLAAEFGFEEDGAFRVSLAHYNTPREVQALCAALESIPNWFGDPLN